MSIRRKSRSMPSNTGQTVLRVERLDDRIVPSAGVPHEPALPHAAIGSLIADSRAIDAVPRPVPGAGHVHPFGSKPGGTGDG